MAKRALLAAVGVVAASAVPIAVATPAFAVQGPPPSWRLNLGVAGSCSDDDVVMSGVEINVPGPDPASEQGVLSAPGFPNLGITMDTSLAAVGTFAFTVFTDPYTLPANTPLTLIVRTFHEANFEGGVAYTSMLTWDCTTGGVIEEHSAVPAVLVDPTILTTTEAGGSATFDVVLDTPPTGDVVVDLNSDPTEGTIDVETLTFTAEDWDVPQTVTVTGVDDDIVDGDVAYTVVTTTDTSADPTYAAIGAPDVAVTNVDDDPAGVPVAPARVLDTRGGPTVDGTFDAGGRLTAGEVVEVPVAGRAGVPETAVGVIANLTGISPGGPGYATLFPCTDEPPTASHLNYAAADVVANNVIVPLSATGDVCLFSLADADYALDVNGYIPGGSPVELFTPARYLDTRAGEPLFDGVSAGGGPVQGGTFTAVEIAGRGAVPEDAAAAIVSVTAVTPDAPGFVSVFTCSGDPTTASTLNYFPGQVVANGALAELSAAGTVCVYTSATAHLLVDVAGFVPEGVDTWAARTAARLFDSRAGSPLVDGVATGPRLGAGATAVVQVTGRADVPAGATGALLNVVAVAPDGPGFITLWPCGSQPETSNVNYLAAGVVRANNAVTKLSADGQVCIFTLAPTDVVLDITGWLEEP